MGGFQVPPMPPQLIEALKRQQGPPMPPGMPPGTAPLNGRPGMTMPQGQMPGPLPMAQPPAASSTLGSMAPKEAAVRTQTGASVPAPTDDPAVVGTGTPKGGLSSYLSMPQLPTPPDYSNSPVTAAYQTYQDTMAKRFGMQPPTPANYRPGLMDRLKGGLVGALVGGLSENADKGSEAGKRFTYSKYNRAAGEYGRTAGNLDKQLEAERGGAGLAEAAGKIPQTDFENRMQVSKEGREQQTAITNSEYKDAIAAIRDEVAKGNIQKAQDLLDEKQKELQQKKDHDAEWYEMQHQMLDLRKEAEDYKEKKGEKEKDHTAQTMGAETQKANALRDADRGFTRAYNAEEFPADPKAQWSDEQRAKLAQLEQQRDAAKQAAQDAYEAKSSELAGAPAEHQDVESWRGKPAAEKSGAAAPAVKPAAQPGAGKTLPMSAIEQAAKDNKVSVDEARRQAEAQGYKVQ